MYSDNKNFISIKERHLKKGEIFEPMKGIYVVDQTGKECTHQVMLVAHNVNNLKTGIYTAVYAVGDETIASRVYVDCGEDEKLCDLALSVASRHLKLCGQLESYSTHKNNAEIALLLKMETQICENLKMLLGDKGA